MDRSIWLLLLAASLLFLGLFFFDTIKSFLWPVAPVREMDGLQKERENVLNKLGGLIREQYDSVDPEISTWLVEMMEREAYRPLVLKSVDIPGLIVTLAFNAYQLKLAISTPYIIKAVSLIELILGHFPAIEVDQPTAAILGELKKLVEIKDKMARLPLLPEVRGEIGRFIEEIGPYAQVVEREETPEETKVKEIDDDSAEGI